MKKNVWIMNHYAGSMYFNKGGRHYWFADFLHRKGYEPVVFCSNSKHNSDGGSFYNFKELWQEHIAEEIGVPFVYIKAREYVGNGKQRILNMIDFYFNLKKTAKEYAKKYGKPDIIYASSVHPLTLVAGIQLARKFGVKCICEVRDLWPESLVEYGFLKKDSILAKILYLGEKWIYKQADSIIMTIQGGYDYIKNQGWDNDISSTKVFYINNGVDLNAFYDCQKLYKVEDNDLIRKDVCKIIYAGAIRTANNLDFIVETAEKLTKHNNSRSLFLIWGDGDDRERLVEIVKEKGLNNIVFKGNVSKKYIPYILGEADFLLLHYKDSSLFKYGQSQNKFFEYLAAKKPILMTFKSRYGIVEDTGCGFELECQSSDVLKNKVLYLETLPFKMYEQYCLGSQKLAKEYDFRTLTTRLIDVIEN